MFEVAQPGDSLLLATNIAGVFDRDLHLGADLTGIRLRRGNQSGQHGVGQLGPAQQLGQRDRMFEWVSAKLGEGGVYIGGRRNHRLFMTLDFGGNGGFLVLAALGSRGVNKAQSLPVLAQPEVGIILTQQQAMLGS